MKSTTTADPNKYGYSGLEKKIGKEIIISGDIEVKKPKFIYYRNPILKKML